MIARGLVAAALLGALTLGCTEHVIVRREPTTKGASLSQTTGEAACALLFRCDPEGSAASFTDEETCSSYLAPKCEASQDAECAAALDAIACDAATPAVCRGCL